MEVFLGCFQVDLLRLRKFSAFIPLSEEILSMHKECQELKLTEATDELIRFTSLEMINLTHLEIEPLLDSPSGVTPIKSLEKLVSLTILLPPDVSCYSLLS